MQKCVFAKQFLECYTFHYFILILHMVLLLGDQHAYLHRIQILQNKAIRAITDVGFKQELTPIYNQSEILKFKNVHTLAMGKFMHQYSKTFLPCSVSSLFSLVNNYHSYSTRNSHNFSLSCYSSSPL